MLRFVEKTVLVEQNQRYANEDGRIGDVEDGEAVAVRTADEGPGFGEIPHVQRYEKHIDDLAVEPARGRTGRGIIVDNSVENRINQVTHGATQNQGHTGDVAAGGTLPAEVDDVVAQTKHGQQPESAEHQLPIGCGQLSAKGHAGIQRVVQLGPVADEGDFARHAGLHVGMHGPLRQLVDGNDEQRQQEEFGRCLLAISESWVHSGGPKIEEIEVRKWYG